MCEMGENLSTFCQRKNLMALLTQWDRQANLPLTPENIPYGSTKKVWWQCAQGHRWQVTVNNRTSSHTDCPYCSGRAAWSGETGLASQFSELAGEWHPTKNLPLTPERVLPGSEKKVCGAAAWAMCGVQPSIPVQMAAAVRCAPEWSTENGGYAMKRCWQK